jgi:drug/metabolite transporter (DMT)-like permease
VHRYWPLLLTLAALWGASYLFIKVAVDGGLEPAPLMAARALLAAVVLAGYLAATMGARTALRRCLAAWRPCLVIGAVSGAIPFWLVAWGETHIDSSVAAIAQSTVPIFTMLLSWRFLPHERVRTTQIIGVGVGLGGVVALAGLDPTGGWWALAGTLAVVLASLSYGTGNVIGKRNVHDVPGPVLATGTMAVAGLYLLVPALVQFPHETPTPGAIASLLVLALAGTAAAQLVYYRTLRLYGSTRVSLVAYLMPGFALAYGVVLLDEPLTAGSGVGLLLILVGVALGSGSLRRRSGPSFQVEGPVGP